MDTIIPPYRAIVFIDGNTFYRKLKDVTAEKAKPDRLFNLNYKDFAQSLIKGNILVDVRYYIGHGAHVIRGSFDKSFQKGADAQLGVEMIRLARDDKYDVAYLISPDTDLVPAVEEVHSFDKKVVYVGISNDNSSELIRVADDTMLLKEEDVLPHITAEEEPKDTK